MRTKRPQGFTLIEIIVTVTIMAIIMSIAASGFSRQNSKSNLSSAAEAMASNFRSTALSALNYEQFQLQSPGSWGVYIDPVSNSYTLFADLNSNGSYDNNEKYKTVQLSKNISIAAINFNSAGFAVGTLLYTAGSAAASFSGTAIVLGTGDLQIQLSDAVTTATESVYVNSFGAVYTQ